MFIPRYTQPASQSSLPADRNSVAPQAITATVIWIIQRRTPRVASSCELVLDRGLVIYAFRSFIATCPVEFIFVLKPWHRRFAPTAIRHAPSKIKVVEEMKFNKLRKLKIFAKKALSPISTTVLAPNKGNSFRGRLQ